MDKTYIFLKDKVEYDLMMKYCDSVNATFGGYKASSRNYFDSYGEFCIRIETDGCLSYAGRVWCILNEYRVIPFFVFAKENNISIPRQIQLDGNKNGYIYDSHVEINGVEISFDTINELYDIFSNQPVLSDSSPL